MHAEAIYWALLTEPPSAGRQDPAGAWLADLLAGWLAAGNRSLRDLFQLHPEVLAAALGRPVEELAPLLALRARMPRAERLLAGLARADVDLLTPWDRRYPRALRTRGGAGGAPPREDSPATEAPDGGASGDSAVGGAMDAPVLWVAGDLDVLAREPVAVLGTRDAPAEAIALARALTRGLASRGRAVLGGTSRAIERAALDAALAEPGGAYLAVLGQGIARALPDLQRVQRQVRAGRLVLLSAWHPEAVWHPPLEARRAALLAALAERAVLAEVARHDGTWQVGQLLLQRQQPLFVRESAREETQALLAEGALPLAWPVASDDAVVAEVLAAAKRVRPAREPRAEEGAGGQAHGDRDAARANGATGAAPTRRARRIRETSTAQEPPTSPGSTHAGDGEVAGRSQPDLVLRALRGRRGVIGKGALLQSLGMAEADLDRALAALIADGQVTQRAHRTGVGYAAVRNGEGTPREVGFQLSLFSQEE